MVKDVTENEGGGTYEEPYAGYMIFIEPNRDRYRGGFEWSVCRDDIELQSGLEFSIEEALKVSRKFVDSMG